MPIITDIMNGKSPVVPQQNGAINKALGFSEQEDHRPLSDSERTMAMKKNLTPSEVKRYAAGEKIEQKLYDTDPRAFRDEWAKDAELREVAEVERVRTEYQARVAKETAESTEREAFRATKNKEWAAAAKSRELTPSVKETKGGAVPEGGDKSPKSGVTVEVETISTHKVPGQE